MTTQNIQPDKIQSGTRIGIDIGGTFTDFVIYHPENGQIETFKLLSTPHNPAEAVLQGLKMVGSLQSAIIIHGSTVATNALLERKGARTALVATCGFRDILQIGRQNRPSLYDFTIDPPPPLVPEDLRFEVSERVDHHGEVLTPLGPDQIGSLISKLQSQNVSSVAICLLFSFLHPDHEQTIASHLREKGYFVSPSNEILPEYREYERASTTTVNAYVSPILDHYLSHLETVLEADDGQKPRLRVMQSNGGNISISEARRNGVRCILSGPAGGVVGAEFVARLTLIPHPSLPTPNEEDKGVRVITFDMGGTSTDVSLIEFEPQVNTEAIVGGCPIRLPLLDIHTIGAGGGSIARVDAGGALRVGPESAGADPGPACYGRGELPTVTDANLVLGRLAAEHFLGGKMPLDVNRAGKALAELGGQLDLNPIQAALGVVEVANAHMERALRVISVERGHDPRRFTLLSFGGAGGLHAVDLARHLGIPRVLVPPLASTLSAFGMLAADVVKDYTQTVMLPGSVPLVEINNRLAPLVERGMREVLAEGIASQDTHIEPLLDIRYQGQSYELTVPFAEGFLPSFHEKHRQTYGYAHPAAPVEIVNVRLRAVGKVKPPQLIAQPMGSPDPQLAFFARLPVVGQNGMLSMIPFYRGESLQPGNLLVGPAVVFRDDTTILLGPTDSADVDVYNNLIIHVGL